MQIRPYTDAEYALLILLHLKRMFRHSGDMLGFLPPRDMNRDNAENHEVTGALQYAIDAVRYAAQEQHGHVSEVMGIHEEKRRSST